ncbi:alpha/beta hydrolase [Stutzerimonas stutzeri]|uniref:Alpha/beta hydrolase n=1 Tax=Stutzerimonas stutzeri TaxID=316 RepID=A0A6I6M0F9_STUST|nr:alpha/beta hydrolase [Stutzerimonas stutzeri]QGZ32171.1 alpha/beta hydrolase [Stutzerimonas stutzeri]
MLASKLASACTRAAAGLMLVGTLGVAADLQARERPIKPPLSHSESREQDSRTFVPIESPLAALPGLPSERWTGIYQGSSYQIEVPPNWNGMLVMYAHGYRGTGPELTVAPPSIRPWLLQQGYAWAASSYSKNYYDVRAGIEDTNALALAFSSLTGKSQPSKTYITGHSMGGHVAAAAVEAETYATANNRVRYDGSVPMCGVTGDVYEFEYLMNFTLAAQHLAGLGPTTFPATDFQAKLPQIIGALWNTYPTEPSAQGLKLEGIVRELSGGDRPIFAEGFRTSLQSVVLDTGGRDGSVVGILADSLTGNLGTRYQFDTRKAMSAEEREFNDSIIRVIGHPPANSIRPDGLRWIPVVNGQFDVPVVSIHTLGDLYVPFKHQQIYRRNAEANGNGELLVQRAIRAPSHCDFSYQEQVEAMAAMLQWEQQGIKPAGDDVLNPRVVADPAYGCSFTRNEGIPTRALLPACPES